MSKSQAVLSGIYSSAAAKLAGLPNAKALVGVLPLSHLQALQIEIALESDARDYAYNAAVSLGEGISGTIGNRFSWASVKNYYSVFYALRGILASNGVALFYIGTTPFSVSATAGAHPKKEKGNTHQSVLALFKHTFPTSVLLSQPIGLTDPLNWLLERREEANYSITRFCDPECPNHFRGVQQKAIRRLLKGYLEDTSHLYTFDADHAILAYPLKCIVEVFGCLKNRTHVSESDGQHVGKIFSDRQGKFTDVLKIIGA